MLSNMSLRNLPLVLNSGIWRAGRCLELLVMFLEPLRSSFRSAASHLALLRGGRCNQGVPLPWRGALGLQGFADQVASA